MLQLRVRLQRKEIVSRSSKKYLVGHCEIWTKYKIFAYRRPVPFQSQLVTATCQDFEVLTWPHTWAGPPSAQLEYLRQYWPRHSEILDMYSTLCCEHLLGIFLEPNCFEENEEIWAVVTLAGGRCHRNLNGKPANAANLCNLCHIWCVTIIWLGSC